jgi:8-oxo-dGTP diphosphatase
MSKKLPPDSDTHLRFAVLAADVALFTVFEDQLLVRLMMVDRPPYFTNIPALPGGLVLPTETAEATAKRIVTERAVVDASKVYLEQLATFSDLKRDPRGRVVAVAYLATVPYESLTTSECSINVGSTFWVPVKEVKKLAYDHTEMLDVALTRLRSRIHYTTLASKLLPKEFTLTELERTYECILGNELDKRNFRKKILKLGVLKATGKKRALGAYRPAELYRFNSSTVQMIEIL